MKNALAFLLFLASSGVVMAQNIEMAVVRMDVLIAEIPEYKTAQKELETLRVYYAQRKNQFEAEFAKQTTHRPAPKTENPFRWAQEEQKNIEAQLLRFANWQQEELSKINAKENEWMSSLRDQAKSAIEMFCKKRGIVSVYNADSLLCFENKLDITEAVKRELSEE